MVKGIENFWKSRGLIDGFIKSRRQIDSGVAKLANDSMSAIRFLTTPKANLPHYLYIFWKLEPLEIDINNVACYRLGTMLHLETQRGKKAMKKSNFQQ